MKSNPPRTIARIILAWACITLFATPVFAMDYHATPEGAGAQDGSDWANAYPGTQSAIQSAINALMPGDTLYMGSGTYSISQLLVEDIQEAGTVENPKQIVGADTGGGLPLLRGAYQPGGSTSGSTCFAIRPAKHWIIKNFMLQNHGFGVKMWINTTMPDTPALVRQHILIENVHVNTTEDGFSLNNASNIMIRNCSAIRYIKKGFRVDSHTQYIKIEKCFADCTTGDNSFPSQSFPSGFICSTGKGDDASMISDDIQFIDCVARNNRMKQSEGSYWNGDGFCVENQVTNVTFLRCESYDNDDAGFDNKATTTLYRDCISAGNKEGFRHWYDDGKMYNCLSVYNQKRGGNSSSLGLWVYQSDSYLEIHNSTFYNSANYQVGLQSGGANARVSVEDSIISAANPPGGSASDPLVTGDILLVNTGTYKAGESGDDPQFLADSATWRGLPADAFDSQLYGVTKGYNSASVANARLANILPELNITATPNTGHAPLTVTFEAEASDADGVIIDYYWTFGNEQTSTGKNPTTTYAMPGAYPVTCVITDNRGGTTIKTLNVVASVPEIPTAIRIEAGSQQSYTDSDLNVWSADFAWTGGDMADRGDIEIAGTGEDRIYQTEHWGISSYFLLLANGAYEVKLHFAETYSGITSAGQRVFSVTANDTIPAGWSNIDVFAEADSKAALVKTGFIQITDNMLTLNFSASANSAMISGIEILPAASGNLPPTAPTGLVAGNIAIDSFDLAWTAASDDVAVTSYEVFLNGVSKGIFTGTNASIIGLSQFTPYNVIVRAVDAAGNASASSETLRVKTAADPQAPFELIMDNADSEGVEITGEWVEATFTSGYYGTNYIHNNNEGRGAKSVRFTPDIPVLSLVTVEMRYPAGSNRAGSVPVDIIHAGGISTVTVNQKDTSPGNHNTWVSLGSYLFNAGETNSVLIRTDSTNGSVMVDAVRFTSTGPDTEPPSAPTGLAAIDVTDTSFKLTWAAATDNGAVAGYEVYINGASLGATESTSINVTGLSAETAYNMTVVAYDAADNRSDPSAALTVATAPPIPVGMASIGLNLATTDDEHLLVAGDMVGVVPAQNWNNTNASNQTLTNVVDNQGNATTATLRMGGAPSGYVNATPDMEGEMADDVKMMRSMRGTTAAGQGVGVTATNIPYASYDVYVYWGGRSTNGNGTITMAIAFQSSTDGSTFATPETKYIKDTDRKWSGAYLESTATAEEDAVDGGNYVVFRNVATSAFKVTSTLPATRNGISGLQIVQRDSTTLAIVKHPQSTTVYVGETANFSVEATGVGLSYQWRLDDAPITGATGTTLSITNAQLANQGIYTVEVSSDGSTLTSLPATLTVSAAPRIVTQPQSMNKIVGESVTFTVEAVGENPTYQWARDGEPILGAMDATLLLTNLQLTDAGSYTVTVSNSHGDTASEPTILGVDVDPRAPVIATQPLGDDVAVGESVTFSVTATGDNLSYQWSRNGEPVADATDSTYTLADVAPGDAGNFAVTVSNPYGSTHSQTATLTVAEEGDALAYFVTPTGAGAKDGSSWANALPSSQIQTKLNALQSGERLYIGSGAYTIKSLVIEDDGSAVAPKKMIGVDTGGRLPLFQGTFNAATDSASTFLAFRAAKNWVVKNFQIKNHGFAIKMWIDGTTYTRRENITIENIHCDSVEDGIAVSNASNITIRNCSVIRYTKKGFRIDYYSQFVTVEKCLADCNAGDDTFPSKAIPTGFVCTDTTPTTPIIHDIQFIDCTGRNNRYAQAADSYWNGDGFSTESGAYNILFLRCEGYDNADAGFDNKASNVTYQDCVSAGNKYGYRQWYDGGKMTNCLAVNNEKRGGTSQSNSLWVYEKGGIEAYFCTFHNAKNRQIFMHKDEETGQRGIVRIYDSIISTTEAGDPGFFEGEPELVRTVTYKPGEGDDPNYLAPSQAWQGVPADAMDSRLYEDTKGYYSGSVSGDRQPPSVPADLQASDISHDSFTLSWAASTDAVGVTGYRVYKDNLLYKTTTATSVSVTGLAPNTEYGMSVSACDASGNESAQSAALAVTTTANTSVPDTPAGLVATSGDAQVALSWTEVSGATGYKVKRSTVDGSDYITIASPTVASHTDTGLTNGITYYYVVTALNGVLESVPSEQAEATPEAATPAGPVITTAPQDLTVNESDDAMFIVVATGDNLSYQWFYNGEAIDGATAPILSLENVAMEDAGDYTVTITNNHGSVTSEPATLTVQGGGIPGGTTSIGLNLATSDTLHLLAAGDTVGVVPAQNWNNTNASNQKLTNVIDNQGNATTVTLQMGSTASGYANDTPDIEGEMADDVKMMRSQRAASNGGGMAITATNIPYASYDIYVYWGGRVSGYSVPLTMAIAFQPGADGSTFATTETKYIKDTDRKWSGVYAESTATAGEDADGVGNYVVFRDVTVGAFKVVSTVSSNRAGISGLQIVQRNTATLAIVTQPQSVAVNLGGTARFSVGATGADLTYQWFLDGEVITGATGDMLLIENAQLTDQGDYTVEVSSGGSALVSQPATLTVSAAPRIIAQPQGANKIAGESATFVVDAAGPDLSYQWFHNGELIAGAESATLSLTNLQLAAAGNYTVTVTNLYGTITSEPAVLVVGEDTEDTRAPAITAQPQSLTVTAGGNAQFSVVATGDGLYYQWLRNGNPVDGATATTFSLENATLADAGAYTVTVTNDHGSITSEPASLIVQGDAPDGITPLVPNQTVSAGHSVNLTTSAAGNPAPSYQWQTSGDGGLTWTPLSDGAAYNGAQTNSLTILIVTPGMDGWKYRCIAENDLGSVTSTETTLAVAPAFFASPVALAVDTGTNIYVADSAQHIVRTINPAGEIATFAGAANASGTLNGTGTLARFNAPSGIAIFSGTLFVADSGNSSLRAVSTGGVVTTLAVAGLNAPAGIVADAAGNMYIADTQNHVIRHRTSGGVVSVVAGAIGEHGAIDATGTAARFDSPTGIALGGDGHLYIADTGNHSIRRLSTGSWIASTLAGSPDPGRPGYVNSTGTDARFLAPLGLVTTGTGTELRVHVADTGNSAIREITPDGVVSTLAGFEGIDELPGVPGLKDGAGTSAWFDHPSDIAVDAAGNLYVADTGNAVIRKIDIDGNVTTLTLATGATTPNPPPPEDNDNKGGGGSGGGGGGGGGAPSAWLLLGIGALAMLRRLPNWLGFCR
jgi:PKD repeat protein